MINKITLLVISSCIVSTVGGCTSTATKWNHPSATADQWAVDKAGCRSRARRLSEQQFVSEGYDRPVREDEFTSVYAKNMRTYDSQRRRQSHYESCLKRLGYTPATTSK